MKRKIALALTAVLAVGMLAGCETTELEVTSTTLKVLKSGKVVEAAVEEFAEPYYNAEELTTYVTDAVAAYNEEDGDEAITIERCEVLDQTAYLNLVYANTEDYSRFNDTICYTGTVAQAREAGFDFNTLFYDVSGAGDETVSAESEAVVSASEVIKNTDLKVFIVKGDADLTVYGSLQYVSMTNTKVSGNTVIVTDKEKNTDEDVLVYAVFK